MKSETSELKPENHDASIKMLMSTGFEFAKICGELFQMFAEAPEGFERNRALELLLELAKLHGLANLKNKND